MSIGAPTLSSQTTAPRITQWVSAINGWGPVEINQSNGENGSGDGLPISVNGRLYATGLGVHANSDIRYNLGKACTAFKSDIGVDDDGHGHATASMVFQVWADGIKRYDSGLIVRSSATKTVNVDLTGATDLALIVTDGGNGVASDHGVWAGAEITCGATAPATPTTPPSTVTRVPSPPLVISGRRDVVISNVIISNPNGPCIEVRNSSANIRIENSEIGPCVGHGIHLMTGSNLTVANNYIHDTRNVGVAVEFVSGVQITGNRIENSSSGVYVSRTSRVTVNDNSFLNAKGPFPGGAFVQLSEVNGGGNSVSCNVGENILGQSYPEDAINIYASSGLSTDPLRVVGNRIRGGGPSASGGGINVGDQGGSNIIASENILVDPGQHGMVIAGGNAIQVTNNLIYARRQYFSNVGITTYPTAACYNITIARNQINYTNALGLQSDLWDLGGCGPIDKSSNVTWAPIDASIFNRVPPSCVK